MKCNYCGKGKGKNHTKSKEKKLYYYYCQECVGDYTNGLGERPPDATGISAEFLTDFETVIEYFKLDGHLVGALRKKWEARRQSGATDK